jgi:MFS family permease
VKIFVLVCVFLGGMGQGIVNPKLPELLVDHASLALDSGISASLMYAGIFFASFLYGRLADRGHVFRLLAAGLFLYALTLALLSAAKTKEALFALRFFEGLSLSAIYVSADMVLCRTSTDENRGQWLSYYGLALSLGLLFGPCYLLLLEWLKVGSLVNLSLLSVAAVVTLFALASLGFRLPKWPEQKETKMQHRQATMAAVLYGFLEAGLVAVLAAAVTGYYKLQVETLFLVLILAAGLASLAWGASIDKFGARRTLSWVFLSLALLSLSTTGAQWLRPSDWVMVAGAVSFGIAAGGIYPAGFAWLIEGSHPSQYGFASGLFTRAYGLGSLFGPLAFGLAVEGAGPLGLFGLATLLGAGGLMLARKPARSGARL